MFYHIYIIATRIYTFPPFINSEKIYLIYLYNNKLKMKNGNLSTINDID